MMSNDTFHCLTAKPIAEGFVPTASGEVLIWREYRWNTGKTSKMWFFDLEAVNEGLIEIRQLIATDNPSAEN